MKSSATRKFWRLFDAVPDDVQRRARRAYALWRADPAHPSIQFKREDDVEPIYSARIGLSHRALGLLDGDTVTWFWIGPHDEYDLCTLRSILRKIEVLPEPPLDVRKAISHPLHNPVFFVYQI